MNTIESIQDWYDEIWQQRYECLITFYEEHQHVDIPRDFHDKTASKLYYWVKYQITVYHQGTLLLDRKISLEKLSFWIKSAIKKPAE